MRPLLDDPALVDHEDVVRHPDGGESVRDQHGRRPGGDLPQPLEDLDLRARVDRRGGLVEHQDPGPGDEGARERDLLPLPHRQLLTVGEAATQCRVQAGGEARDGGLRTTELDRGADPLIVGEVLDLAEADVLPQRHLVPDEVLEQHRHR